MSDGNESQPKRIHQKINYKIIVLICAGAIAYQLYTHLYTYLYPHSNYLTTQFTPLDVPWIVLPFGIGITSLIISKRYWDYSDVLGKAYLALSIGWFFYAVGSSTYEYMSDIVNPDSVPYPSLADVFFLASYPFWYYHLARNVKYYAAKISPRTKIVLIAVACGLIVSFTYLTVSQTDFTKSENYLMFYTSEIYVACDSVLLSLAILGAVVFRKTILGNVWLLLMIGFLIYQISDYWYYYASEFNLYDETHPSNALFQLGFAVIIYALYMHKKLV